jgi:AcrR family transcriptional regulator
VFGALCVAIYLSINNSLVALTRADAGSRLLLVQVTNDQLLGRATARRAQIVEATIATIAELGYQRTTFIEIAKRAPLSSTRLISYHFRDRDDLMDHVANEVVSSLGRAVETAVRKARSPAGAVRAYIRSNLAYMDSHRPQVAALMALMFAGSMRISSEQSSAGVTALAGIISHGRELGQFRDVDSMVAATIVHRAVEGFPLYLRDHPDVDVEAHAAELVRFFDASLLATATEPAGR